MAEELVCSVLGAKRTMRPDEGSVLHADMSFRSFVLNAGLPTIPLLGSVEAVDKLSHHL